MKLAIAMTAFDRPEYLARALCSYDKLEGCSDHDFYFFIDGPYDDKSVELCAKTRAVAEAFDHPSKTIITRDKNVGIAHQIYESKTRLFSEYDMVLSCVDDYDAAPYALTALKTAYLAVETRVVDPFILDVYRPLNQTETRQEKRENLDLIRKGCHGSFYLMARDVWAQVEPYYAEYIRKFIQPSVDAGYLRPYSCRHKNNAAIRQWLIEILGAPMPNYYSQDSSHPKYPTSQDGLVDVVYKKLGINKLSTHVNHVECFGAVGEHMTQSHFNRSRHSKTLLNIFDPTLVIEALSAPRIIECALKE